MSQEDRLTGRQVAKEPMKAVEMYQQGIITLHEIPTWVFENLTRANVDHFLGAVPPDIFAFLQERVSGLPAADDHEAWSQLVTIESGNPLPIPVEELRRRSAERKRLFREGVEIFRESVAKRRA